jgi:hypothetical protein
MTDYNEIEMSLEAVFLRRRYAWQNGFRPVAVYSPDAVDHNGQPRKNAGKAAKGSGWREEAMKTPPRAVLVRPDSDALNTAFLLGELVVVDVDVLAQDLVDQLVAMIEARAGPTPLIRQGQPPKLALLYRAPAPYTKIRTPDLVLPDDTKAAVEILAKGQACVVDGVHAATGRQYQWLDQHWLDVPLSALPELTEATARGIIEDAEEMLRAAGGVDLRPRRGPPPRSRGAPLGQSFFNRVNEAALAHLDDWVRLVFPKAVHAPNGSWRIPAKLRGLPGTKQDISLDPRGIRDWHEDRGLSAIDFVRLYGRQEAVVDAALWLCEAMRAPPGKPGLGQRAAPRQHHAGGPRRAGLARAVAGGTPRRGAAGTAAAGERAGRPFAGTGHPGGRRRSSCGGRSGVARIGGGADAILCARWEARSHCPDQDAVLGRHADHGSGDPRDPARGARPGIGAGSALDAL